MAEVTTEELQSKLDELVKHSDYMVGSPEAIEKMRAKGLPIKSTFTTFNQYLDKLFDEKRKIANDLIKELPLLNENISNATINALYEEFKECFVLGIPGAGITLASIMLELALKYTLYKRRLIDDQNSSWEHIEEVDFSGAVNELFKKRILTKESKKELDWFNVNTRNPYIHYNIKKIIQDMKIKALPIVNVDTGSVDTLHDVDPSSIPSIWFSAKRVRDKKAIGKITTFCISWVNQLLSTAKE